MYRKRWGILGAPGGCDQVFFFFSPISLSAVLVTLEPPQLFRKLPRFWQLLFCFNLGPGNCLSRKHQGKAVVLGLCKKERRLFLKVWFVLNRLSNLYLTAFESTCGCLLFSLLQKESFERHCLRPHSFRAKNAPGGLALNSRPHRQRIAFSCSIEPPEWCLNSASQNVSPFAWWTQQKMKSWFERKSSQRLPIAHIQHRYSTFKKSISLVKLLPASKHLSREKKQFKVR